MNFRGVCCGVLVFTMCSVAMAQGQFEKDKKNFGSLFMDLANWVGPFMVICGMKAERDELLDSFDFLLDGYQKLNEDFPELNPPLRQQVLERNDARVEVEMYGRKTPSELTQCESDKKPRAKLLIKRFHSSVKDVKVRLSKAGYSPSNRAGENQRISSSSTECPMRAQYYQDEYQRLARVDDLICLRKALERELTR